MAAGFAAAGGKARSQDKNGRAAGGEESTRRVTLRARRSRDNAMQVGDTTSWERTFTVEDVTLFGQLSRDQGIHHVEPDEQGRLMVQGLLTATLPTKLGGDLNYIARELIFEFLRPVFTGDTIYCETTITHLKNVDGLIHMSAEWICQNQKGKPVLTGRTSGIIREAAG